MYGPKVCVLLCFIKPIFANRYVRSQGFIVSEPRETHPRSEIADVPTLPCPPLDNLGGVLLCFIKPILGNRYGCGPGVIP